MPRNPYIDDTPDDDDDRHDPQEADLDQGDEPEDTRPCPRCGREIWEQAERCNRCGAWITAARAGGPPTSRRRLYFIGIIALALLLTFWLVSQLRALSGS